MDQVFKEKWVAALRSGEYIQTKGVLTRLDNDNNVVGCCCLGVACEIAVKEGILDFVDTPYKIRAYVPAESFEAKKQSAVLPDALIKKIGVDTSHGVRFYVKTPTKPYSTEQSLPALNDDYFTFDQIADIIEYFG